MSDTTPILSLPLIQPAQAQKHVTHNEALRALDVLVQPVVTARLSDPPAAPDAGARYLVGGSATAAFAGKENRIALWSGNAWQFFAPRRGWSVHVLEDGGDLLWTGSAWSAGRERGLEAARIGVSATADATNRLSVSSPATLLTHAGAGHQVKINKAATTDTASLLYQSNWSGRAEIGLNGTDDLSIKTSANGSAWVEALRINGRTGAVSGAAVQADAQDAGADKLMRVGAFGIGTDRPHTLPALGNASALFGGPSGLYAWAEAPSNAPAAQMSMLHLGGDGSSAAQIAVGRAGDVPHAHVRHNGAPWAELLHKLNMVGPVAREGEVPTGAVMQRGSAASGEFLRLADGTLICFGTVAVSGGVTTTHGALFQSAQATWTYPAAFVAAPVVMVQPGHVGIWAAAAAPAVQNVATRLYAAVSTSGTITVRMLAIGRWA
ncbi:DUF2793 domain-containing protein [Falsirhodobacter halotolerans]|uniref:DUF2793 domain-containing protein n=1 Tax=Falsirhodobacter halotolerans TaxID=1146892 RepID=UPI001FD2D827|nr:DUF2793 domain-containing protein [Falsirhodobacter halotolerans]MCJ8138314.1 DUF2793 domain-containing protein [Falsirhodobacter halotolerans]